MKRILYVCAFYAVIELEWSWAKNKSLSCPHSIRSIPHICPHKDKCWPTISHTHALTHTLRYTHTCTLPLWADQKGTSKLTNSAITELERPLLNEITYQVEESRVCVSVCECASPYLLKLDTLVPITRDGVDVWVQGRGCDLQAGDRIFEVSFAPGFHLLMWFFFNNL